MVFSGTVIMQYYHNAATYMQNAKTVSLVHSVRIDVTVTTTLFATKALAHALANAKMDIAEPTAKQVRHYSRRRVFSRTTIIMQ